jgi:hypothetical protein
MKRVSAKVSMTLFTARALHGRVIRQHGENCFASAGIGDRVSRPGALGKQWFRVLASDYDSTS